MSQIETIALLKTVSKNPGLKKQEIVVRNLELLQEGVGEKLKHLGYLDILESTKMLLKHDFKYYITPRGLESLNKSLISLSLLTEE